MRGRPTKDPHTRPAINTLERLHMELGGQIHANRQQHDALSEQMRHVEAVIKMLDPSYNLGRIAVKRRKPNPWFKRGTLYRRALDVLRTATEPMTALEMRPGDYPRAMTTPARSEAGTRQQYDGGYRSQHGANG